MRTLRFLVAGAVALSLLWACNDKEETEPSPEPTPGSECEITVETNEWNAPAVGELTTEIAVEANADWEITNTADWLTAEKTDTGVKLTASENEETEGRTAEVVLTCTDGVNVDSETITVTQDGRAYVNLGSETVYFGIDEGSQSIDVDSNFDWTSSTDETWLTVTGSGSTLTVSVSANESGEDREGTVTVTASDGAENKAEATFTVKQPHFSAEVFVLEYTMTDDGQEAMLPLSSTVDCTVDWGDGSEPEDFTTTFPTHTYTTAGNYEIQITGTVTELASYASSGGNKASICNYLTAVKQWGETGLTSMKYAFRGCSQLKTLPEVTGDAFADVTTFLHAFRECALEGVPADLFSNCPKVTTMSYLFCSCEALTSIPDGLFDNCPLVDTFAGAFKATAITAIPEGGLFDNCPKVTTFESTFEDCVALTTIPDGLFDNCPLVETFISTFAGCTALTTIPDGLFENCTAVTTFKSAFKGCTALTTIPDSLFGYCTYGEGVEGTGAGVSFESSFESCTSLQTIPDGLFDKVKGVMGVGAYLFRYCESLTTVPNGLFAGCEKVQSFAQIFRGCTSLEAIPDDLFEGCSIVGTVTYGFYGCTSLKAIPTGLFDDCLSLNVFSNTFNGCTSLTGESPYTVIEVSGESVKVHLYERSSHTDIFANVSTTNSKDCFTGCTGLSDYDSIPSTWGGGGN